MKLKKKEQEQLGEFLMEQIKLKNQADKLQKQHQKTFLQHAAGRVYPAEPPSSSECQKHADKLKYKQELESQITGKLLNRKLNQTSEQEKERQVAQYAQLDILQSLLNKQERKKELKEKWQKQLEQQRQY
eukprot:TRINITY_DN282_c1_g1_i4.p3 TRINITY_DN282_c1_g1~~TRINITY_DN282_c1_g1_i4.p3  ORF type:complete len:130 (-),score=19.29 TRINITY_DN282_c1_g1_i4:120-509(-)